MKIAPYVRSLMQFAMPDIGAPAGGGGGGGNNPPPPPPPGKGGAPGGNAPPPEPKIEPAEHEPEIKTPAQKEIEDFTPPSLDDIDDPAVPPKPPEPPKPDDPKPPKPGETKPPAKPPEVPDDKKPAKQLRDELVATRKERDELKSKVEKGDPKLPTVTAELEETKKLRDAVVAENDELRKQLAFHDPSTAAELKKMDEEFNAGFDRKTKLMPQIRTTIGALVGEFRGLPDGEKYSEALEAFEAKVAGVVGQARAQSAMQLIQEGAEFFEKRETLVKDLKTNGLARQSELQQKGYDDGVKLFNEDVKDALAVPEALKQQHPYHPLAFVENVIAGFDDGQKSKFAAFLDSVDRYTAYAAAGISPKTMAEFSKMEPAERDAAIKEFNDKRRNAVKVSRQMIKRAYVYEKLMTGFLKNYAAMEEKLRKLTGGQPPDPNNTPKPGGGAGDDNIQEFKATVPGDL